MVQCLRLHVPVQEVQVASLVRKPGAIKSKHKIEAILS